MEQVLIIEQDAPLMRVMSAVLARSGIDHVLARDLDEAARIVRDHTPEVIIFNTELPAPLEDMAIEALRALAPGVRVLDLHAHPPRIGEETPLADAFLHKPFRADEFVDAVRSLLDGAETAPA
jgi:DNA-binding response OmpR family regulator